MIIHKQGKQKVSRYTGFGRYEDILAPLCVGAKSVYKGKSYYLHRNWKYVTCKHCLKKKLTSTNKQSDAILKEADILRKDHPSKDCRFFAESVFHYLNSI